MSDRENVINDLEYLISEDCTDTQYDYVESIQIAIDMLKEQEAVVRCRDCKHRPKKPDWETFESGADIEFPEGSKCPCHCSDDEWYSWYPDDEWFCAEGECK